VDKVDKIGLSEVIVALRQELNESMAAAKGSDLKFKLGDVTIELELAVERSTSGKGGLTFWVLNVGGEHIRTRGNTHRITVPLTPLTADGGSVYTRDSVIPGE
jgi:hypothetical protein